MSDPKPGEIRVINGQKCRFIERELEGEKWEVIGPASPPSPQPADHIGEVNEMVDLAELKRLAEAATPGPWTVDPENEWDDGTNLPEQWALKVNGSRWSKVVDAVHISDADSAYIAAATPSAVLALLDLIARQQETIRADGAALRPFAEAAATLSSRWEDYENHWQEALPRPLTVGHLKTARARLSAR